MKNRNNVSRAAGISRVTVLVGASLFALAALVPAPDAFAQGKGNGKGKNNGGGKSSASKSVGNSKSKSQSSSGGKKSASSQTSFGGASSGKSNLGTNKTRTLASQLKSLNSLKRSSTAIANSSDPKLAGVQNLLAAKEELGDARKQQLLAIDALEAAKLATQMAAAELLEQQGALEDLSALITAADSQITELNAQIEALDPETQQDEIDALALTLETVSGDRLILVTQEETLQTEVAALNTDLGLARETETVALGTLSDLSLEIDLLEEQTGDDALSLALKDFLLKSGQTESDADVTPELLQWAKDQLSI